MTKNLYKFTLASTILLSLLALAPQPTFATTREHYLQKLIAMRNQNASRLQQVNNKIKGSIELGHKLTQLQLENQVDHLKLEQKELALRQTFLDQIVFQVDGKYKGDNPRAFFSRTLHHMAIRSATDQDSPAELWKFFNHLSVAVRDLPEPNEDIVAFIEGYMKFSTIAQPISPSKYLAQRNYTNGTNSVSARPTSATNVGERVEAKLNKINKSKVPQ